MRESGKTLLRLLFEAETDVQINPDQNDWKLYAEWLENLAIDKLNEEIIAKNNSLNDLIYRIIEMLHNGISKG